MNNKVTNFMLFVFGVAIGSATTFQYIKKKHDEIDPVKEVFSFREIETNEPDYISQNRVKKEELNITEYASKLHEEGYTNYSNVKPVIDSTNEEEEKVPVIQNGPYVISPDDFGEFEDYETISLTYYSDNIIADDNDELVEDIEDVVGFESLKTFGDYEDDSIFVRNKKLKCDYEILLDQRKFSDVIKKRPHEVEGD